MHAIAHGGCTDIVRESALEVDCGRKIACRIGDSRHLAWLFSRTLYQLISCPRSELVTELDAWLLSWQHAG